MRSHIVMQLNGKDRYSSLFSPGARLLACPAEEGRLCAPVVGVGVGVDEGADALMLRVLGGAIAVNWSSGFDYDAESKTTTC